MIDEQELRAIQFLAERVRKASSGCAAWDSAGLAANLRKLATRNLHMTIEHVMRHAADPQAKTPGVLVGSYTPDAPTSAGHPFPPRRDQECRQHPGQWPDSCAGCKVEGIAAWHDDAATPPPTRRRPADRGDSMKSLHDHGGIFPHLPGREVAEEQIDVMAEPGSEFRAAWEYALSHAMTISERSAFWHGVNVQRRAMLERREADTDEAAR